MQLPSPAATEQQIVAQREHGYRYIHLKIFLETQRDAEILKKEFIARCNSVRKKTRAIGDAMAAGWHAVESERNESLRNLIKRGQLLHAFEGTTMLQGGAA